MKFKQGWL